MSVEKINGFIACPACKISHLPTNGQLHDGVYAATCEGCGNFFKFKVNLPLRSEVSFVVNGKEVTVGNEYDPATSLNEFLRDSHMSMGTKYMCREGGCGLCVVMATSDDPLTKKKEHRAINSCLCPLYMCDGLEITTIEGIGSLKKGLHPIQSRLNKYNGSQCGFCSPAQIMNMYALLKEDSEPSKHKVEDAFDGIICRCTDNTLFKHQSGCPKGVAVVCEGEDVAILQEFHSGKLGGHSGVNKTIDAIKMRYWWPGLTDSVKHYIKLCEKCQKSDPIQPAKKPELKQIDVCRPFELVGCDLMGPFKKTNSGNVYIFMATDYYTKWVEAFPIVNKTALEVSKCLKKILYRHGAMTSILTDQGREFVNEVNRLLCEEWNVTHKMTAAYHPQTNGLDERTNQTIKIALSKYVNQHSTDWDEWLDEVLFSLRTKPQASTKYTPFFLLYGREALYPSQLPSDIGELPDCPSEEFLAEDVDRRAAEYTTVQKSVEANVSKAKGKQQRDYEKRTLKKRKFQEIKVGDSVLKYNAARAAKKSKSNLENSYTGPYIVRSVKGGRVQLERNGTVLKSLVSIQHVKLFQSTEESSSENVNVSKLMENDNVKKNENVSVNKSAKEGESVNSNGHENEEQKETIRKYVQDLADQGIINQLFDIVQNFKLEKPVSIFHTSTLLKTCPVYSLVNEMERLHADCVELVAGQLLPLLRNETLSLSRRRDVVMILSSLCYKALLNHECPVIMAETLKICPSHLSQTEDRPSLSSDERINVGGETLDSGDLSTLENGQWINDKVVNAFLTLMKIEKNRGATHVIVLPSYLAVLWQAGNYASWLFLKVSFAMFSCILLPICRNGHWILMAVSPSERIVRVYDSLHGNNEQHFQHWLSFMRLRNEASDEKLENWRFVSGCCSKQEDGNNCGTFVLMNAEAIIKNVPTVVMRQTHCEMYRMYVRRKVLMEGKRRNENKCDYAESCSGAHEQWIQCDCCGKWLHMICAKVQCLSSDSTYMCVFCCAMYK